MKKTISIFIIIIVIISSVFTVTACGNNNGITNGTYAKNDNNAGIGNEITVKGSTISVSMGVLGSVDYTYKIAGDKIKLTTQGGTLSYPFEKKDNKHYVINGAEYVISTEKSNAVMANADTQSDTTTGERSLLEILGGTTTEAVETTTELAPTYTPLNLPFTMKEQTFSSNANYKSNRINPNGDLVETATTTKGDVETTIDSGVRSLYANDYGYSTYFYIKTDNSLWGYGSNVQGKLGDGTGVDRDKPVKILDDVAWVGVYSGNSSYAIKTDKSLWAWGDGTNYAPVMIAPDVVKIIGNNLVLTSGGFVVDYSGAAVDGYPSEPVYDIQLYNSYNSTTGNHSGYMYISSDKNLYVRYKDPNSWTPIYGNPTLIAENVEKFWVYGGSVYILKADNSLWGYGQNINGELGDGTKIPERAEPVKISDDVSNVFYNNLIYAFLKSNGEFWSWDSQNPTPQKTLNNVADMQTQGDYTYMTTTDGKILYKDTYWDHLNWSDFADMSKLIELKDVKIPQTVTFP